MATVVNQTQLTLAVDLELPHTPMKHLGVLAAGEQLAVAESHLDGGLRITDCGVGASAAQVQVAVPVLSSQVPWAPHVAAVHAAVHVPSVSLS